MTECTGMSLSGINVILIGREYLVSKPALDIKSIQIGRRRNNDKYFHFWYCLCTEQSWWHNWRRERGREWREKRGHLLSVWLRDALHCQREFCTTFVWKWVENYQILNIYSFYSYTWCQGAGYVNVDDRLFFWKLVLLSKSRWY